jgi:hypothetical protein
MLTKLILNAAWADAGFGQAQKANRYRFILGRGISGCLTLYIKSLSGSTKPTSSNFKLQTSNSR